MAENNSLQKFLNRNSMYLVMYGHIEALRLNSFQFNIDQSIANFKAKHGLSEDDLPLETARKAYWRMQKDHNDSKKTHGNT